MTKIDFKYIWKTLLEKKKALIIGQFITIFAVILSIPIPLMLPALVDEVFLKKPDFFVFYIDKFFGSGSAFYYIFLVTLVVVALRLIHFIVSIVVTKIFTAI